MSNTPMHGSDVQETPDWWKASDGRFYPPELHPNYVKPDPAPAAPAAAAAAPAAAATPSLADRLRAEADRVGDEAAAAADAGVGSMDAGGARDTLGAAKSTAEAAAGGVGGAAAVASSAVPSMPPAATPPATPPGAADPRATMPATPPQAASVTDTVMQHVATPPAATPPAAAPPAATPPAATPPAAAPPAAAPPGMPPAVPATPPGMPPAAPSTPPGMPPAPSTPAGMPPAPSSAPAMPAAPAAEPPATVQGPGGITYTAAPDASPAAMATLPGTPPQPGMPQPGMPGLAPTEQQPAITPTARKIVSSTAGAVAVLAGLASIIGSFLKWGKGSVLGADGAEKAIIEVAGFDSSGMITAICGAVLLICGALFFMGTPKQLNWAILAFLAGAAIVGSVVFSMIDIGDLSNRYAAQWQSEGLASVGDVISTQADLGLWVAGAGGVLGVLSAPFVNRG